MKVGLDLPRSVRRQGEQTGLVEFGLADEESAFVRIVIPDLKPEKLSAPQPSRVKQHEPEPESFAA
jgi:hypothetical protein